MLLTWQSIVLTNRHVVGTGPWTGYILFNNQEEVDAFPIYRDPVHDFGFLKFDPSAVKHMKLAAIKLRPDLAKGKGGHHKMSKKERPS